MRKVKLAVYHLQMLLTFVSHKRLAQVFKSGKKWKMTQETFGELLHLVLDATLLLTQNDSDFYMTDFFFSSAQRFENLLLNHIRHSTSKRSIFRESKSIHQHLTLCSISAQAVKSRISFSYLKREIFEIFFIRKKDDNHVQWRPIEFVR